jgi:hypothetical protein
MAALAVDAEASYVDVPLEDVIGQLAERHGLQVMFARGAIEEAGATIDYPHSVEVRGVSLRNLLELVLDQHGLTWIIRDEVLVVTSKEAADNMLRNRVYPVADILAKGFEGSYGVDDLSDMIQSIVAPQSWDEVGGPGSVPTYPGALVVRQTQPVHEEIERLLAMLRELPAEEFWQASTRVYTIAGVDPDVLAVMLRKRIDAGSWLGSAQHGKGTIEVVHALAPWNAGPNAPRPSEELAESPETGEEPESAELPQFGGSASPAVVEPPRSGWLLIRQSKRNHERIEQLLRQMNVLTSFAFTNASTFPIDY